MTVRRLRKTVVPLTPAKASPPTRNDRVMTAVSIQMLTSAFVTCTAGYAYVLSHPGTPCVFWDHLQSGHLQAVIQRLIAVRRRAGIHCRSAVQILKCACCACRPNPVRHPHHDMYTYCISYVTTFDPRPALTSILPIATDVFAFIALWSQLSSAT